jgi:hypothetical protein
VSCGNGEPPDYNIEEFRNEHYAGFTDIMYFKRLLEKLSVLNNKEIEVDGDMVRLTKTVLITVKNMTQHFVKTFIDNE